MDLSIIIPVFNEQGNIKPLWDAVSKVCREKGYTYEILFVDDGSADNSLAEVKEAAEGDANCRYIALKRNFGQTAAMAAGLDNAQGDYIVTMDGDLQNDPQDIPAMLDKCRQGYDLVNGWRKPRRDPILTTRLPSFFANILIRKITGVKLHDTGCTLKVFKREVLKDLHLYGEMHRFIPALLHWKGAKIGELKVNHRKRERGKSKYGPQKLLRVILDILNIKFLISYSTRPIQIFGKIGFYTLILSMISLGMLIYMKTGMGIDMTGNPLLMLTVFLAFIGIQFITMGLLGEINIRIYHESTQRTIYSIAERSE